MTYHILLSRPQKILRAGGIEELGRTILYPLYSNNIFSTKVLEEFHQMYCSKDTTYPIGNMLREQLFHKNMKAKSSQHNKICPMSCIYQSLSMEERYRIYYPMGLCGQGQFLGTWPCCRRWQQSKVLYIKNGLFPVKLH